MSKKHLLFTHANEFGGVCLTAGFVASVINNKHSVKVITLANYYKNSSVFLFNKNLDYNSLDKLIYSKNLLVRLITYIICVLKPLQKPKHFRVENNFSKSKFINIKKRKIKLIKILIHENDVIVICNLLGHNYTKEIVEIAYKLNKPIFYRTTGEIKQIHLKPESINWYNKVTKFIHHSKINLETLSKFTKIDNHKRVDQNAYFEDRLLNNKLKTNSIKRFFTLSVLIPKKNIESMITVFKELDRNDIKLSIYGSGVEEEKLKKLANNHKSIEFKGKVDFNDIHKVYDKEDCLLISSISEGGPYTGIESMASGTPIISTKVGAMPERLSDNYPYFYDSSEKELKEKILDIVKLNGKQVFELSNDLRKKYLANYSEKVIRNKYKEILFNK